MVVVDKIAILLATYNGERFIRDQIDSLLSQTYNDFVIYIRDDGSNDDTLCIIESYISKYPEKFVLLDDEIKHRGAKDSFMYLLEHVDADYYMFCDQDDVWLPDKVEVSLAKIKLLEKKHSGKPVMVHTDLRVVDEHLTTIYESLWKWAGFAVDLNKHFNYVVMGNVFTGCTMIINNLAKRLSIPIHPKSSMHDEWIGLIVSKHGIIDNIKNQTILYRQHGKNVCSMGEKKDFSKQKLSVSIFYKWYYDNYELIHYLGYGSVLKGIFYKSLYLIRRRYLNN